MRRTESAGPPGDTVHNSLSNAKGAQRLLLDIDVKLNYAVHEETDLILQIVVPGVADQHVRRERLELSPVLRRRSVAAGEHFGERQLLRVNEDFLCHYSALVEIDRVPRDLSSLPAVPPHRLPAEAVRYLMPSRYCQSDELQRFVEAEFGDSDGGERVQRLRDWIYGSFLYAPGYSDAQTTALDTFVHRQGVCRDYAHVLIALARASSIPARFVSAYAPHVTPPDFHALVEVFLDGSWHLVDPTGMAAPDEIARIGVGMDAAEVAFLASFAPLSLQDQRVGVTVRD
jgi:transglutaminase-like putative cysteine protease